MPVHDREVARRLGLDRVPVLARRRPEDRDAEEAAVAFTELDAVEERRRLRARAIYSTIGRPEQSSQAIDPHIYERRRMSTILYESTTASVYLKNTKDSMPKALSSPTDLAIDAVVECSRCPDA